MESGHNSLATPGQELYTWVLTVFTVVSLGWPYLFRCNPRRKEPSICKCSILHHYILLSLISSQTFWLPTPKTLPSDYCMTAAIVSFFPSNTIKQIPTTATHTSGSRTANILNAAQPMSYFLLISNATYQRHLPWLPPQIMYPSLSPSLWNCLLILFYFSSIDNIIGFIFPPLVTLSFPSTTVISIWRVFICFMHLLSLSFYCILNA